MKDEYDVAVVGAGPGGTYAAKKLAEKGLSVLCIDKREEIGAPVRCGEGLAKAHFKRFGIPEKGNHIANNIYGMSLISPNGTRLTLKDKTDDALCGYLLERKMFDKYLAIEAARAGAEVQAKVRCTGVLKGKNGIEGINCDRFGEEFEVRARLTVAADGVDSKVARWAGIDTAEKLETFDSGFQYEMAGIDIQDHEVLEFYIGNSIAPSGYIWVFPKGKDVANVGIGINAASEKNAKYYLDRWVKQHGYGDGSIVEVNGGGIPVGGVSKEFATDGLVVVGDAARQVSPIHGGGIAFAMGAGSIAAEVGAKALEKGDVSKTRLDEYKALWDSAYGKTFKRHLRLQKIAASLNDAEIDQLATVFDTKTVLDMMDGKTAAVKTLIKKSPKLGKLLFKFII
ncbi:MAG: NAD(P)/FAD-dependent oxidoreductase [archaeon]